MLHFIIKINNKMSNPFYYINTKCEEVENIDNITPKDVFYNFIIENNKMIRIKEQISKNVDKQYKSLSDLDRFVLTQKKFNQTFYDIK